MNDKEIERYRRLDALLSEAMELPTAERNSWLQNRSDSELPLARQVIQLLSREDEVNGFFEGFLAARDSAGSSSPGFFRTADVLGADPLEIIGGMVGKYRILEKIGAGGVGVVYKAHDPMLDRFVALKFMSPVLTQDEITRQRFIGEAKAVSRLEHACIAGVYEAGMTADKKLYIAMSFCDGDSLREILRNRQLTLVEAWSHYEQIIEGLVFLHGKEVVHRDLKPGNIMVGSDGQVKIVDFGLASILDQKLGSEEFLTGTLGYMAPEQMCNNVPDARIDIWGAGMVLYEMLFGCRPQRNETGTILIDADKLDARRRETGESVHRLDTLVQVALKSLELDPEARYTASGDIEAILQQANAIPAEVSAIASHTPAARRNKKAAWFTAVAIAIVSVMFFSRQLLPMDEAVAPDVQGEYNDAWAEYLKGENVLSKERDRYYVIAADHFHRAIALDSTFARAHASLVVPYYMMGIRRIIVPREKAFELAETAARTALRLDALLSEAHASMALVHHLIHQDPAGAEASFVRALELDEDSFFARREYGLFLIRIGRGEEGLQQLQAAVRIRPDSPRARRDIAWTYYYKRDYDGAIRELNDLLVLNPEFRNANRFLYLSLYKKGLYEEALEAYERTLVGIADSSVYFAFYGEVYAASGDTVNAERILDRLMREWQKRKVPAHHMALVYLPMGKTDEALKWLEQADKENELPADLGTDPRWDALRMEPRFQALLAGR